MKLAILGPPDGWYARDLQRTADGRHDVEVVPFTRLAAGWDPTRALTAGSAGRDLTRYDAVLVRSMPPGSLEQIVFRMDVLQRLEASGVVVMNPPKSLEAAIDKFLASACLRAAGLPVPETYVCQTADDARAAFVDLGGDVVVKPLFGSEGRGLMRIDDEALAERAFKTLAQLQQVIYLQRYVPHHGHDIRLLVIGEDVLAMRRVNPGNWRTNVSQGGRGESCVPAAAWVQLARRAAGIIGAPVAGVDILPGLDGRPYVLEVNAVPGWKALADVLKTDVALRVLDFLCEKVRQS